MPEPRPSRVALTRADLPEEFTPETVRGLPIGTLRRLADHRSGILSREEQQAFDRAMHEVMGQAAQRVSQQLTRADWAAIRRDEKSRSGGPGRRPSRADQQLDRLARRIGQQVDLAEALAPNVDWSFAQSPQPTGEPAPPPPPEPTEPQPADPADPSEGPTDDQSGTVSDLEQRISEQVELVEVMTEIADVSKRTYGLEQQRDLQSTRTVFFGFVVSVAVIIAGWAPLVAADDWSERLWTICLTVATCVLAGVVYALVRRWQNRPTAEQQNVDDDA